MLLNIDFNLVFALSLVSFILYSLFVKQRRKLLEKKWGCRPISCKSGGVLKGISKLSKLLYARKHGNLLRFQKDDFLRHNGHTISSNFMGRSVIQTKNAENVKAVLATQFDKFSIGMRKYCFRPLLGDGIFASEGERWKHSRQMLRPQFAREQVAHVESLEPHMQVFFKHIRLFNSRPFDIQALFHRLTMDTATEFLFGESLGSLRDESVGYYENKEDFKEKYGFDAAFNVSQNYITLRLLAQSFYFLVNNKKFRECNAKVHEFTQHYVNRALEASQEELDERSKKGYTILYELVKHTRDPKVLQDELLSIMLAGKNTTASLLSFLFYELSRNQQVWIKLKEEIYKSFGSGEDLNTHRITFESMKKCAYLKWVINEALRLYPPVSNNLRVAKDDTFLPRGGDPDGQSPIFCARGTTVFFSVYSTQRLSEYYGKTTEEFIPERWADLKDIGWAFMPFGSGPRVCLGQQFALTEVSYVTIRIAQTFPNMVSFNLYHPPKISVNTTIKLLEGNYISLY